MERRCVLESRVGPSHRRREPASAGPALRVLRAVRTLVPASARRVGNRVWSRLRDEAPRRLRRARPAEPRA